MTQENSSKALWIFGGIALVGTGLYLASRYLKVGKKFPGDKTGATVRLMHRGPSVRVWIGFGIGPGHQDPVTMPLDRWIGGWFNIPATTELTVFEARVEGAFPVGLEPGTKVDCNKIVGPYEPPFTARTLAARYDDDWDDEVYLVGGD